MRELSEMIRDYVDAAVPRVSLDDVLELAEGGSDASASRLRRRRAGVALVVAATVLALALVVTLILVPTGVAATQCSCGSQRGVHGGGVAP